MRSLWETEAIPDRQHLTVEEECCESFYKETTEKNSVGRFVVRLPFKESPTSLGNSLNQAVSRFKAIERRFIKEPKFQKLYNEFMEEYLVLGHMREIKGDEIDKQGYYIPHHGILKQSNDKQKIRVVFDASAKDSKGTSLNDILRNGPTVQSTLYSILMRFRMHQYVFTTDIKKMYRQILIAREDQKWQRIVWRSTQASSIKHFELQTVTYGTKPAPFLATRTIKQIAEEYAIQYPNASREISENMYVDDLMVGAVNKEALIQLKLQIQTILFNHGMCLGKWVSNCSELLEDIAEAERETISREITEQSNMVKVLGLLWDPINDQFTFSVKLPDETSYTKRAMLSEVSRIFDPLGLISPCVIPIKILLQQLWKVKLDWDDDLPIGLKEKWMLLRGNLVDLRDLSIPRWAQTNHKTFEIHGFCDASEQAYGAVVYVRTSDDSASKVVLLTSKSKVAPVKSLTIPKLELCAAVLLTKLLNNVKDSLSASEISSITAWSDSQIVLDWLSSYPKGKDIFVKNRIATILDSFSRSCWNHVSSNDNPADLVSRGTSPEQLQLSNLWWYGPSWLSQDTWCWPKQLVDKQVIKEDFRTLHVTGIDDDWLNRLSKRVSTFRMIVRVIARIKRISWNTRVPKANRVIAIANKDIIYAEYVVFKNIQHQYFNKEIVMLQKNKDVMSQSTLRNLNPFLDTHGILRVGGRLLRAKLDYNVQHPILLISKSVVVHKLVQEYHIHYRHAGPTLLNNILKQKFWIIGGRKLIRSIFQRCVHCQKAKPKLQNQLMADLPECRVTFTRPFLRIGVDYAGPFMAYHRRGRGQRPIKSYVCIYICLSTKAVHVEVANDLTTEEFLGTWKRMTARRGLCTDIFSDCGSNFIGANNLLLEWFKMLKDNNNQISAFLLRDKVNWHFNPPSAPHFGGIWEAAVKSFKTHLRRVVGQNILTVSEFNTLITEIEGILNSRPLIRGDDDVDVLTPSHFLIGHPITHIPEPIVQVADVRYLKRWQLVKQMKHHFWIRWHKEYLVTLQHRYKWKMKSPNLEVNDIVLIKTENMAAIRWPLGRVMETHLGADGLVRTVTLKIAGGTIQRPIHKLVKLTFGESTDSRVPGC